MRIKQLIIEKIRSNPVLQGKICAEFNKKSMRSIERWLNENKDNGVLTTKAATRLICAELNLDEAQILEDILTTAA
ncbi:MAG: hypothetical protein ABI921_00500 [Panacibacter sp.]